MKRARVLLTHGPDALANYYGARALAALEVLAVVRQLPEEVVWSPQTLAQAAAGCQVIVSDRRAEAGAALLASLPELVAFCRCAVDIRNIDVAAASAQGILVTQASAGFMTSVAEWVLGVMIDASRGISASAHAYRSGEVPMPVMGRELRGSTLGLIGYGQIGRCLATIAAPLGLQVLVADPHVVVPRGQARQVPLAQLLAESDHVVCLVNASPETENLIDAAALARMKPTACFINASRGDLVDETALLAALDEGTIAAAALDVGRAPDQMPSLALARHPRVIATPHIGGLTPPSIEHQSMETVRQVAEILQGRAPVGAVNTQHAQRLQRFAATTAR